jgi:dihydroorotase
MPDQSQPRLFVRGGSVLSRGKTARADLVIEDGRVVAMFTGLDMPSGATVLDAGGCILSPGLVDLHTHLREPGGERAETIETGTRAAVLGGYTAVVAMPNTTPAIDSAEIVRDVRALAAGALCEVAIAGAITVGRAGEALAPLGEMAAAGVRLFTDDGSGVQDPALLRRALEYGRDLGVTICEHCEDAHLAAGGHMHEGEWSERLGIPGQPGLAEEAMLARDLGLVELTGAPMHFLHISTARSVELLREARRRGLPVTGEVTPHHLALSDAALASYDPVFKVNPPLRTSADAKALAAGLADRTIDAIATDHAPHPTESKEAPITEASPGMLGLETALAVVYTTLVATKSPVISIERLVEAASAAPARIAGLATQGQDLVVGAPANICVFDPGATWTVDPDALASRARNTPFAGWTLTGRVRHTIAAGEAVVIDAVAQR